MHTNRNLSESDGCGKWWNAASSIVNCIKCSLCNGTGPKGATPSSLLRRMVVVRGACCPKLPSWEPGLGCGDNWLPELNGTEIIKTSCYTNIPVSLMFKQTFSTGTCIRLAVWLTSYNLASWFIVKLVKNDLNTFKLHCDSIITQSYITRTPL